MQCNKMKIEFLESIWPNIHSKISKKKVIDLKRAKKICLTMIQNDVYGLQNAGTKVNPKRYSEIPIDFLWVDSEGTKVLFASPEFYT